MAIIRGTSGNNRLIGTAEADALIGLGGNDRLTGAGANDALFGGAGHDYLDGGLGADFMAGEAGNDTYVVNNPGDRTTERDGAGDDLVRSSISETLHVEIERLILIGTGAINGIGNGLDNRLTGNGARNRLDGGAGNDVLTGNDGNDILDGGTGIDRLSGGRGSDTYILIDGADRVIERAGEGVDTVEIHGSHTLGANVENLTLTGILGYFGNGNELANRIIGNRGDNSINGFAGADRLFGGLGNDNLSGGSLGNSDPDFGNLLDGGEGNDFLRGAAGDDRLLGGIGNDQLFGGPGGDVLDGGAGNDILAGGPGSVLGGGDSLTGGAGDDIFQFLQLGDFVETDIIRDFGDVAGNNDLIDLAALAPPAIGFTFNATEGAALTANMIVFSHVGGETVIQGDVNGDTSADFAIRLTGNLNLDATDFVL